MTKKTTPGAPSGDRKPQKFLKINPASIPRVEKRPEPDADLAAPLTRPTGSAAGVPPANTNDGMRGYLTLGVAAVILLVGGVGGWAATTEISGAVIAPGVLAVDSNVKPIQHPTGGVVSEIKVRNGDRVNAGDLLVQLDETVLRAQMQMSSKQIDELQIRSNRLKAERDEQETLTFPRHLLRRQSEEHIADAVNGEARLFKSRVHSHSKLVEQLRERVTQLKQEISGVEGQIKAKDQEIELIQDELEGLEELEQQQLVTKNRITSMRRQAVRLKGERAQLASSAAQSRGRIAEIEINILQREEDRKTDVVNELREVQSKLSELGERKIAALDQLRRVDITAPQGGIIHELSVHSKGAVIQPGNPILMVVPAEDDLVVTARIPPAQIDRVRIGSTAFLLFTALNQRTTPMIEGIVRRISADLTQDKVTGEYYYSARILIEDDQLKMLGDVELIPGMPIDVQIRTDDRTALSYLLKPFTDQAMRAFRER
ncbi:MAG: HlyD family type I secretion periplasmic adaptor subunit [Pseudomonadota bacterium]